MNTQLVKQQVTLTGWAAMIREQRESGQSIKEYCRNHGFSAKTYYYRLKRVREFALETNGFSEINTSAIASPAGAADHYGFSVQMLLTVGGIQMAVNSETPKELLMDVIRVARDA